MAKGFFVGVENFKKRDLPSGYTQVEYIESTGSQYIDTGICPNQDTRIVFFAENTSSSSVWVYGAWDGTDINQFTFGVGAVSGFRYGSTTASVSTIGTGALIVEQNANAYTVNSISGAVDTQNFECSYPIFIGCINAAGSVSSGKFYGKIKSCQIYKDGVNINRDYVPAKNSSGEVGMFDMVTQTFYTDMSGTGFVAGAEYSSIAKKVKQGFIGVGGISRKIKKAFIGIGGIARPCWSGGELAYYGTATDLSATRYELTATNVGNYALFGGGYTTAAVSITNVVDAYDASLIRSTPTALSISRYQLAAISIGNYALFGGGYNANGDYSSTVDAYNTSLIRSTPTVLSLSRSYLAATSVGDYALFGGGFNISSTTKVDAYNTSLTRSTPTTLTAPSYLLAATTVGGYALFGGGYSGSVYLDVVNAYDTSLTRSMPTVLSRTHSHLAATTVGDYALFGGGYVGNSIDLVNAYDTSLTRTTPTALNTARYDLAATTVGDYALFGGGNIGSSVSNVVDVYDISLTHSTSTTLNTARRLLAATSVGDYALFGGGSITYNSTSNTSVVDVYTIA